MNETIYPDRPLVAVDLLALQMRDNHLACALICRDRPPFKGCCALPGRLVRPGQSCEEAALAELKANVRADRMALEQLYTYSEPGRDPRGQVISVAYLAILPPKTELLIARWYDVTELDGRLHLTGPDGARMQTQELAFDHGRILTTGLARLKGKIDYTDIAFHFLKDLHAFSLGELQRIFEAVLSHSVDKSNFRRFLRARYLDTGHIRPIRGADPPGPNGRGRPPTLYRMAEDAPGIFL